MPLITTNNLDSVQVASGQDNQFQTFNDKVGELDSFLTESLDVSVSSGNATVSAADYRRYRKVRITGNTTAGRSVTLQAIKREVRLRRASHYRMARSEETDSTSVQDLRDNPVKEFEHRLLRQPPTGGWQDQRGAKTQKSTMVRGSSGEIPVDFVDGQRIHTPAPNKGSTGFSP